MQHSSALYRKGLAFFSKVPFALLNTILTILSGIPAGDIRPNKKMDTSEKNIALQYDYGLVREAILSKWSPERYFESNNLNLDFISPQIKALWSELVTVEQSFSWNSISYLSFLITELLLKAFLIQKAGDRYARFTLEKMLLYGKKHLDSINTKRKNKSPELSSTIEGFCQLRNRVAHHGIPFSDNSELRATQALVLMVRVISDVFSPPLRKFSDERSSDDPNWWISRWRDFPPIFVITRLKRNSPDFDNLKKVVSDPDIFFDHVLPFVSASRILDLSHIAKKFGIESTKLRSAIERNFYHLIIGSGESSIENSMRTIEALRKMGLLVFAESFAILLPLNRKLVEKALLDLDDVEIIFFLRQFFRYEHQIFIDDLPVTSLEKFIVKKLSKRFKINSNKFDSEKRQKMQKALEALPHRLRKKIREALTSRVN